mgnify:CR=1 FL=1
MGTRKSNGRRPVSTSRETGPESNPCHTGIIQGKGKESYRVGYRCPPKEYQFKPGQSGNPKGRPKNSVKNPLKRILLRLLDGPYEVGYCRPPKEHQFKPGQSGNPTGKAKRPKRRKAAKPPAVHVFTPAELRGAEFARQLSVRIPPRRQNTP